MLRTSLSADRRRATLVRQAAPSPRAKAAIGWRGPVAVVNASTMANRTLMLGSEVDMWGEGIDDTNFEPFVFPKALAAAERMWSSVAEPPAAGERLANHRCAVVGAGVRVAPIGPGPPCAPIL